MQYGIKKIPAYNRDLGYKQKHMKQMRLTIKNVNPVKPYSCEKSPFVSISLPEYKKKSEIIYNQLKISDNN